MLGNVSGGPSVWRMSVADRIGCSDGNLGVVEPARWSGQEITGSGVMAGSKGHRAIANLGKEFPQCVP